MPKTRRPRLAVWKLASCDGCQLSLLDCEDQLLVLADQVEIAYFKEATSREGRGPFDLSLVDGSVTTPAAEEAVRAIRAASRRLVSIGACATAGGIQGLRNFSDAGALLGRVYPRPERLAVLPTSTPVSAHVPVDFELRGCPVNRHQLLEVIAALLLHGRAPQIPSHSVCVECKIAGNVCVLIQGVPCLGPVTHAGCGALCPGYARGCYGCYGPMETPRTEALSRVLRSVDVPEAALTRAFRTFTAGAPAFREASLASEGLAARGEAGVVEPRLLPRTARSDPARAPVPGARAGVDEGEPEVDP